VLAVGEWLDFYKKDYVYQGKLIGLYYNSQGNFCLNYLSFAANTAVYVIMLPFQVNVHQRARKFSVR
jgi:hypothetical protein